jgi:hypothetical protein
MKLELWTRPNNYLGQTWEGYYVFLSQTRDSEALTRSNFECALDIIKNVGEQSIVVSHERHWACGWLETILIPKENTDAIEVAQKMLDKLDCYPILNEEHYYELEYLENPEMYQE